MSISVLLLTGWTAMALLMLVLWAIQRARGNAGIVDVAWALGTAVLGVAFAWGADGDPIRRLLIGLLAGLWGLRLGGHLLRRVAREAEDVRYRALRQAWGERAQRNLFLFFQVQALWAVLFAAPMLIAARNPSPAPGPLDLLGLLVWLAAVGGEGLADWQLARFRERPDSAGNVCREGLWRYSRHPNYFFEWLHWWVYVAFGAGAPLGWLTLFGPAIMLVFLFKVTGILPTEARLLASRGEAYREYQRTTSAFFPWPPKREVS